MRATPRLTIPAILVVLALSLAGSVAAQTDGLDETSVSTFTLLPDEDRIHADIVITLVNERKARVRSWGSVWTPDTAQGVKFAGKGVTTDTVSDAFGTFDSVKFPALRKRVEQKIRVSYDLVDDVASGPATTRLAPGYARFCWGGEPTDTGRVRAILPTGWQAVSSIDDVRVRDTAEGTVLRPMSNELPGTFFACTDAFQMDLASRIYVLGPSDQVLTIDSWHDDPDFEPAVTRAVGRQLRDLESLIGTSMPYEALTVQEVDRADAFGSASDFVPAAAADALLLIDEDVAAPGTATVAFARTWFNEDTIADAWLAEGLALWAGLTIDGAACPAVDGPDEADAPDLADWYVRDGKPFDWEAGRSSYQRAAACTIVERVATELGQPAMTEVMTALLTSAEPAGWSEWLDTIEAASPEVETTDDPDVETAIELAERLVLDHGIASAQAVADRATNPDGLVADTVAR